MALFSIIEINKQCTGENMYKIGMVLGCVALIAGCSSKPIDQQEYKQRLKYCEKIEMDVNVIKNEKSNPIRIDCVDQHGSVFDSRTGY